MLTLLTFLYVILLLHVRFCSVTFYKTADCKEHPLTNRFLTTWYENRRNPVNPRKQVKKAVNKNEVFHYRLVGFVIIQVDNSRLIFFLNRRSIKKEELYMTVFGWLC